MNPIYFPFTYTSKSVLEAFGACFNQVVAYQPSKQKVPDKMQKCAEEGMLDIRIPVKGDEKKLDAILKDYINWANLHQENKGLHKFFSNTGKNAIPFFNETSMYHIKTNIRKKMEAKQSQEKPDPLLYARIFMTAAQEFDIQNMELYRELSSVQKMEQNLLANLKGDNGTPYQRAIGKDILFMDDPGDYMISERFETWTRLYMHDQMRNYQDVSSLFITSSKTAFQYLIDNVSEAEKIICFDSIPVCEKMNEEHDNWKESLMEYLNNVAKNRKPLSTDIVVNPPVSSKCEKNVTFTLYFVPDCAPNNIFARCVDPNLLQIEEENEINEFNNTLLGLFEI